MIEQSQISNVRDNLSGRDCAQQEREKEAETKLAKSLKGRQMASLYLDLRKTQPTVRHGIREAEHTIWTNWIA
jgi:hypothetical protein